MTSLFFDGPVSEETGDTDPDESSYDDSGERTEVSESSGND